MVLNKTAVKELGQRRMPGFRLRWRIEEEDGSEVKILPEKTYIEEKHPWYVTKEHIDNKKYLVSMVNLVHEARNRGITMEKVWSVVLQSERNGDCRVEC